MLNKLIEKEQQRAKALEEKTAKMTFAIAVALTIGSTFSVSVASAFGSEWKILWGALLPLACLYAFIGGWIGLFGMATNMMYGYGPDWEFALKQSESPDRLRAEALARYEISNLRLVLLNTAATQCLRNAFILFTLGAVIAGLQPARHYLGIFSAPMSVTAPAWPGV